MIHQLRHCRDCTLWVRTLWSLEQLENGDIRFWAGMALEQPRRMRMVMKAPSPCLAKLEFEFSCLTSARLEVRLKSPENFPMWFWGLTTNFHKLELTLPPYFRDENDSLVKYYWLFRHSYEEVWPHLTLHSLRENWTKCCWLKTNVESVKFFNELLILDVVLNCFRISTLRSFPYW